ncbi:hypothetical protein ACVND7_12740 [Avibacterium paragallinarum]
MPEVSEFATAMKTIKLFGDYLHKNNAALMEPFLEALNGFGQVLDEEFKK